MYLENGDKNNDKNKMMCDLISYQHIEDQKGYI